MAKSIRNLARYVSSGLLAASVISVVQLSGVDKPSAALTSAIHAFSISIPLLAGWLVIGELMRIDNISPTAGIKRFSTFILVTGIGFSIGGMGALFLKYSANDYFIFMSLTVILFIVTISIRRAKLKSGQTENKQENRD